VAPIDATNRARVRLACANAIQGAVEAADFAHEGAGVDAIFPGSPFEHRFREIISRSKHAPPILNWSGGSCSACRPSSL
jgi:Acyl-CoA dehydrogenase, C-terminal domain